MSQTSLTDEQITLYRRTAERLREQDRPAERLRREEAWRLANVAAALLKEQFNTTRVVVFGSLAAPERTFTRWSDIDIAAWGIAPEDTLRALGAVMDLSSQPVVNLVDVNVAKPAIMEAIVRDGVEL